ncbi:HlyD family secretion protein [Tautonia rosea]|uniref:HlyD family secretion protein n=1 Tax=Tautonia rosea TaxID=2728037 RepID=UPI0014752FBE|nr:HlyD family efflux transporter periplasmic adaptor subunit [Tautonia rosea]
MSSELRPEEKAGATRATATRSPGRGLLPTEATMLPAEVPTRRPPMRRPACGLPAIRPRPGLPARPFDAGSRMPALHQVGTPRTARRVGFGVILVCVILPFVMIWVPWRQSVYGDGQVTAFHPLDREYQVFSPIYGRVVEFYVNEGDRVEEGQIIARVENIDPQYIETLEQQKELAVQQLEFANQKVKAYEAALEQKVTEKEQSVFDAEAAIASAKEKIKEAEQKVAETETDLKGYKWKYEQVRALYERGLEAGQAVIVAEQTFRTTGQKLNQMNALLQQATRDLEGYEAKAKAVEAKAQAEVEKAKSDVQNAQVDVQNYENKVQEMLVKIRQQEQGTKVLTSQPGTVLRILTNVGAGAQVKDGDPLAIIIPDTPRLAAEIYLPGRDVPLVHAGDPVRLQFEGWPALQFMGWPSVAIGTFPAKVALVDASETKMGRFRILAVPDLSGPQIQVYDLNEQGFSIGSTVTGLESGTTGTVSAIEMNPDDPTEGLLTITGISGEFLPDEPIQDERDGLARVESPWPSREYLRQGARANGWVLLREVPLGFEIWRRLNGFAPVVADQEPSAKDGGGSKDDKPKVKRPK